ncbi:MAG: NIPSNAP family protein [Ignavibacteriales bacterium]|nr:NIPSNAP family protein [Ignavibacteriales bacterium]
MSFKKKAQRYFLIIILTGANLFPIGFFQYAFAGTDKGRVIHQLRIYEIFDGNKKAFHDRFRDHAMRIMAKYDFNIIATWETKNGDRTEFVYLLEWPDKETMKDRWARFMADQEWIDIKKETSKVNGALVGEIQNRTLELTDYSPRKGFAR